MPDKLHHTRGIVLRTTRYGETSLIVSIFTELFGLQSYLLNGVRSSSRRGSGKANVFQPAAILELVVYHSELKQLQRIKEFRWGYLYERVLSDIPRNAVAMFMIELLGKCLKQPEPNPELFQFTEDAFTQLDRSEPAVMANFPLFFALHLPVFFGFRISDNHSEEQPYLDLREGEFTGQPPAEALYLDLRPSQVTAELLRAQQPSELAQIRLNGELRRQLLQAYAGYYSWHLPEFGAMRTLPVLREILS